LWSWELGIGHTFGGGANPFGTNELPLDEPELPELEPEPEPMCGQLWPLPGAPERGAIRRPFGRVGGVAGLLLDVVVVLCEPVVPDDVEVEPPEAAFAIAAPPPTRAPVRATVVMRGLSRMSVSPPLLLSRRRLAPECRRYVGAG
jgi:hypothetical protein